MSEQDRLTQVLKIIDLVDYQDDAIVSRTLVKQKAGSVTVFAFDKGQELSAHTVPFDAWVHLLDGSGRFTVDDQPHQLGTGDSLLMPADHPHSVKATDRFKMVLSMVKSDPSES
ncbi:MAG: cupin [Planctomycetaceae bacterium]|nr:cupin [Planctomycetaceae bacterium]